MDTRYAKVSLIRVGSAHGDGSVRSVTGAAPLQCRACGARYDESTWCALVLLRRLEEAEVRRHIVGWPDGTILEARRCGECDGSVAARVIDAAPGQALRPRFVGIASTRILTVGEVIPFGAESGARGGR